MKKLLAVIAKELPGSFFAVLVAVAKNLFAAWGIVFVIIVTLLVGAELQRQGATIEELIVQGSATSLGTAIGVYLFYFAPMMIYEIVKEVVKPRNASAITDTGQVAVDK